MSETKVNSAVGAAKPLRLAQVVDTLVTGGAERLIVTFALTANDRKDIDLTVIVFDDADTPFRRLLEKADIRVVALPGNGLKDPRRLRRLYQVIKENKVDFVHAHLSTSTILAGLVCLTLRVPFATTIHNVRESARRVTGLRRRLFRFVVRNRRTHLIAVGHAVAKAAQPEIGDRDITVVHNAISSTSLAASGDRDRIRQEFSAENKTLLIAVGAIIGQKAFEDMISAFSLVRTRDPNTLLLIAGNAPETDRLSTLNEQIKKLKLEGSVRFLGLRTDIPALLAGSDMFVSSSHWEGTPVSLLEAMANGLPCVVTDVGDNAHILNGTDAVCVPPKSPTILAEAISTMASDQSEMRRIGEQCKTLADKVYGAEAWVDRLITLYKDWSRVRK